MEKLLGEQNYPSFSGRLAMVVVSRYFILHYWCGCIALVHQLAERFYLGKGLQRLNFSLLIGICCLTLLSGLWLQPMLKKRHATKYGRADISHVEKQQAAKEFRVWHAVASAINLVVLAGLGVYLWRMANPPNGSPRFAPSGKFRG